MKPVNTNSSIFLLFLAVVTSMVSCTSEKKKKLDESFTEIPMEYAKGFRIFEMNGDYVIEVVGIPGENETVFTYFIPEQILQDKDVAMDQATVVDHRSNAVVLTETTQIPHLVLLKSSEKLVAFPNLDLISSPEIREKINNNEVLDLGSGPAFNFEKIIDLSPDWIMISSFGGGFKTGERLKKAGIPVVINNEYLEPHPLGRAEWIKFTGVLLGKLDLAENTFQNIKASYQQAQSQSTIVPQEERPKVLSGSLYRDVWFAPGGESWMGKLIQDAGGTYVFREFAGKGSLELNYEYVLDEAWDAAYWIGASDYSDLNQMRNSDSRYQPFRAFQEKKVYTYTLKRGEKGGIIYFEEGYMRPDWVLMDLIKILHPTLAPDHQFQYFTSLDE